MALAAVPHFTQVLVQKSTGLVRIGSPLEAASEEHLFSAKLPVTIASNVCSCLSIGACIGCGLTLCSPAWQQKDVGAVLRDEHRRPIAEWGALLLPLPRVQAQLRGVVAIEGALQVRLRMPPVLWHACAALNACCLWFAELRRTYEARDGSGVTVSSSACGSSRPDVAICMLANPSCHCTVLCMEQTSAPA
jgi:hypothetical protein